MDEEHTRYCYDAQVISAEETFSNKLRYQRPLSAYAHQHEWP